LPGPFDLLNRAYTFTSPDLGVATNDFADGAATHPNVTPAGYVGIPAVAPAGRLHLAPLQRVAQHDDERPRYRRRRDQPAGRTGRLRTFAPGCRRAYGDVVPRALPSFGTGPRFRVAGTPISRTYRS
jgi:hypothetical protein